ncbi:MAG: hypothetical protein AAFP84_16350 [Actinomycetota bacterium]
MQDPSEQAASSARFGRPSRHRPSVGLPGRVTVVARRWIARHPWVRWSVVVGCVAVVIASWLELRDATIEARNAWGERIEVWVAARDHEPGDSVEVVSTAMPRTLVPAAALDAEPADEVARRRIAVGEVVVGPDVAGPPRPVALAPTGSVVVAVADPLVPDAPLGAAVLVVAEAVVLADAGVVTSVHDGVIGVAVPAPAAPAVAAAARQHLASLVFPADPSGG